MGELGLPVTFSFEIPQKSNVNFSAPELGYKYQNHKTDTRNINRRVTGLCCLHWKENNQKSD